MSVIADPSGEQVEAAAARAEFEHAQAIGAKLDMLERRAEWLDEEFRLPFTDVRVGVASIIGFLPGAGDSGALVLSATIIYHGMRIGASTTTLAWMSLIVLIEGIVGVIPVVGDAVGLVWTANVNNVERLRADRDAIDGSMNWVFLLLLLSPFILFVLAVVSAL
ncbi:DUF4112 domain-containing protein [Halobaculum sp. CBA1158]|uniref:DUF4112 domain-containing protein n=1 Tax=Halobaculum sp. CBA1158 TaxID=2904243 RepID=UPI001F1A470D|nr:DUF4112 domain-containing protein [Halobaculum sp. CBA1158]UIO99137.1 DUF4112 domain-containing protein [Halobaculum sp. CBA1158]